MMAPATKAAIQAQRERVAQGAILVALQVIQCSERCGRGRRPSNQKAATPDRAGWAWLRRRGRQPFPHDFGDDRISRGTSNAIRALS
jgi:hypothetical protein